MSKVLRGLSSMFVLLVIVLAIVPYASAQTTDPILVAAGDMSGCSSRLDEATAALVEQIGGTVATLGDNTPETTADGFNTCYEASWGRFKSRTYPAAGNREYGQPNAQPYFDYFGDRAGPRFKGFYSYNVGTWHVVVLNNYVDMTVGSEQERWLRADLAANPTRCTLAYWHEPRWTSGTGHADAVKTAPLWQALYEYGADLILNGHEHHYERFARQNPSGQVDNERGIRQIIVGTGGSGVYGFGRPKPNSEVRNGTDYGVLKLTLRPDSYQFQFVPISGGTFTDQGSATCSPTIGGAPTATPTPLPTATRTAVPTATRTPTPPTAPTATPALRTRFFTVEADARLVESTPTTNFGQSTSLRVNGGTEPVEWSVLRVTVGYLSDQVVSAKLRVYATSPTAAGPSIYRITNSWGENAVNWNGRPTLDGAALDTRRTIDTRTYVDFDVTDAITGVGTYSFALVGASADGVDFSSRQGGYPPQLLVMTR